MRFLVGEVAGTLCHEAHELRVEADQVAPLNEFVAEKESTGLAAGLGAVSQAVVDGAITATTKRDSGQATTVWRLSTFSTGRTPTSGFGGHQRSTHSVR